MIFENESEMVAISNFMNNAKFGDLGVKDCAAVLNAVNIVNDAAKKFVDMRQVEKDEKESK